MHVVPNERRPGPRCSRELRVIHLRACRSGAGASQNVSMIEEADAGMEEQSDATGERP